MDIDSKFRINSDVSDTCRFSTLLDRRVVGVVASRIKTATIPSTFYEINHYHNILSTYLVTEGGAVEIKNMLLVNGTYTMEQLASHLTDISADYWGVDRPGWTWGHSAQSNKFAFHISAHALYSGGGVLASGSIQGGETQLGLQKIMGITEDVFTALSVWTYFENTANLLYRNIYITIPQLASGRDVSTNARGLNWVIMAKIPVRITRGDDGQSADLLYAPESAQMSNFTYERPRDIEQLEIICFAQWEDGDPSFDGFFPIDFHGQDVNITLELDVLKT